jgi:hypothetical protein
LKIGSTRRAFCAFFFRFCLSDGEDGDVAAPSSLPEMEEAGLESHSAASTSVASLLPALSGSHCQVTVDEVSGAAGAKNRACCRADEFEMRLFHVLFTRSAETSSVVMSTWKRMISSSSGMANTSAVPQSGAAGVSILMDQITQIRSRSDHDQFKSGKSR